MDDLTGTSNQWSDVGDQEEQATARDDDDEPRPFGRRRNDQMLLAKIEELEKRFDRLERDRQLRHATVDAALKRIEDMHDGLFEEPHGAIWKIKDQERKRDLQVANWKFLMALLAGASGFIGALIAAGERIRDLVKAWLT